MRPNRVNCSSIVALIFLLYTGQANALTINTTFDSTVTGAGNPNAASWVSAWNYAVGEFQSTYSDPITINIKFQGGGGLGGSNTNLQFIGGANNYAAMRAALIADATTANDATATSIANMPVADPTGGRLFIASFANAKALGLRPANDPALDGTITLGLGHTYTYDPNNRAVAGAYDFIGVVEHEMSEVMGRIGILGQTLGTGSALDDALDLFGFNSTGVRNLNQNQPAVYFSINNGVTHQRVYNDHSNGGDDKDWESFIQGADSFNAFGATGVQEDMSSFADRASLDVIGYNLVPEPSTYVLLAFGAMGLLMARRAKRA